MKKITTNTIEVRIYETKAGMRKAVRKLGYDVDHTESIVIPCRAYEFRNGKQVRLPLSGELYTHKNINLPVLVHETLHAATTALRFEKADLNLRHKINYREELLAYKQTAILQDVLNVFFPITNSKYDLTDIKWWATNSVKSSKK